MTVERANEECSRPELSVVVPICNEADCLREFLTLLFSVLRDCCGPFEVWVVDDGSQDDSWSMLCAARESFPELFALRFTRNFGKEAAILAGLRHATGQAVVVMDGDGQHPPSLLPRMLDRWRVGKAQIVAAQKAGRQTDRWVARMNALAFNGVMRVLTGLDLSGAADFRLLDRKVVNVLLTFPEKVRFFRGMTEWTGFDTQYIPFDVAPRIAGTSQWTAGQHRRLAVTAIAAFSAKPLRMILRAGLLGFAVAVVLTLQALYSWITGIAVSGWTSITIVVLLFGSANLLGIGVLGIYLAQLFNEIKGRPEYLVNEELRQGRQ